MKKQKPEDLKTRPDLDDESWLAWTAAQPENRGIDVRTMYRKMLEWCDEKGHTPTRRRLLRWLDNEREAVPMTHKPAYFGEQKTDDDCDHCGNSRSVVINDRRSPCPDCRRSEYDAFWKAKR